VWKDADGNLTGARYDDPMARLTLYRSVPVGFNRQPVTVSSDDRNTVGNESGTVLTASGTEFPLGTLLEAGSASVTGPNMVAAAREELAQLRDGVAAAVELHADGGLSNDQLRDSLHRRWDSAQDQVDTIFGTGEVELTEDTNPDRVVREFDRLVDALEDADAFARATDGGGEPALDSDYRLPGGS